jgi:2-polyprenyl-3-methyl-5-hydroxy-6-metoxy-1,4-benzoquinol methylase
VSVSSLRCPCGGEYAGILVEEPTYRELRCGRCGLVATDPRDVDVQHEYDEVYFERNYLARRGHWTRSHRHWFEQVIAPLMRGRPRPRILDVGAGVGLFLSVVPSTWERIGLEPAVAGCRLAADHFGLEVRPQLVEELSDSDGFDVVTCWDVVEHVKDPIRFLRAAHRHVRSGGFLVVKVPHIGRRSRAIGRLLARARKGSIVFQPSAHLYQFDRGTLAATLVHAGVTSPRIAVHRAPFGIRSVIEPGRLAARVARLGLTALGADRVVIAVAPAA